MPERTAEQIVAAIRVIVSQRDDYDEDRGNNIRLYLDWVDDKPIDPVMKSYLDDVLRMVGELDAQS